MFFSWGTVPVPILNNFQNQFWFTGSIFYNQTVDFIKLEIFMILKSVFLVFYCCKQKNYQKSDFIIGIRVLWIRLQFFEEKFKFLKFTCSSIISKSNISNTSLKIIFYGLKEIQALR